MSMDLITLVNQLATELGVPYPILILALLWSLFWKALALWKAGRKNQPFWFIAILLVNTLGLLEILYIFAFSKIKLSSHSKKKK